MKQAILPSLILLVTSCARPPSEPDPGPGVAPLEEHLRALLRDANAEAHREEIARCLKELRSLGRTQHLCYLAEYGLRVHLRNLEETKLARILPIEDSPALAELVRIADLPEARTPYEGGWLQRQFYGPFIVSGWSSFQVYLWAKEREFTDHWPNESRMVALLERIEASPASKIGGEGVCHYGCR